MNNESLYFLGVRAKAGDELALLKIIEKKKSLIKKMSLCYNRLNNDD